MTEQVVNRTDITEPYPDDVGISEREESSIDFIGLFQTLYRRRMMALKIAVAIFALTTIYVFLLPPLFTSGTSFIPPNLNNNSSMSAALAGQLSTMGVGDLLGASKTSGDLYAGILSSRSIASELVKRFGLLQVYGVKKESQAEKTLAANTNIVVEIKSSIVTVQVTDKDPKLAHDLASGYMDALREAQGRLALGQSSQRRLFFGQQLAKEKNDLEEAEVELKKMEEHSGLIAPAGQTQLGLSAVATTQGQIAAMQVQLAMLRESATDQNPEIIRLQSAIDDLRRQLANLQSGSGKPTLATIPASRVPALQLEYVRKAREVKYHEALFEILSRQFESARLDEARDAPVMQVLDPASYPDMKSSPKRALYMLVGLMLGVFAGCSWVLVREPLQRLRSALAQN